MVLIGASAMAIVSLVIAVAFLYYARQVSAMIGGMGRAASTQAASTGDHIQCTGIVCGCTFVAQSALWFLSTLNLYGEVDLREDSTTSLLLASFTLELLTVLAIIYMYSFPIEKYVQQARGSSEKLHSEKKVEMASVDENAPEPEINYEMDDVAGQDTEEGPAEGSGEQSVS